MSQKTQRTIGVDTGGTFTDLVEAGPEGLRVAKLPSTPDDPSRAVLDGLAELGGVDRDTHVVHGTTVALNALLTGRVARTALVTNRGFRDLIEIGRQDRPDLYALHPVKPRPFVPRELRFELAQRSWPDETTGRIVEVERPSRAELDGLLRKLRRARPESVAICLLHAYADPAIEERVARALGSLGVPITCSGRVLAEYREYERYSTAVANAVLVPRMRAYVGRLERELGGARLSLLQSNGGTLLAADAAEEPVRVLLSGPAGGVVGAARAAHEAGFDRIVGFDMGGTSTDVSFHDEARGLTVVDEPTRVAGHPIGVPSYDIHTIGCGGGSLVTLDRTGVLAVGPESAGADPGPVAYGRSDRPCVTDAHVELGHIAAGTFLDGALELDRDAVARAFEELGARFGARRKPAARAVLDVARAAMRRAVGVMTMQRGEDPESLVLVAYGGAGGLHAAAVAQSLAMRAALIPLFPGCRSAVGMVQADAIRESSASLLEPWDARGWRERKRRLDELGRALVAELRGEGHAARAIELEFELDLRYAGQSYELRIAASAQADERFAERHAELYGYRLDDRPVELVNLRARARVRRPRPEPRPVRARKLPAAAKVGERFAWFERRERALVVARDALAPGHSFEGPALVEEYSGTTLVPPGARARVTAGGHLLITFGNEENR